MTAIGHAQDVTLLEQIADRSFPTPTALGTYLRDMAQTRPIQPALSGEWEQRLRELDLRHRRQLLWAVIGAVVITAVLTLLFISFMDAF